MKILNPLSGRYIQRGGNTHIELFKKGVLTGAGNPTKGWKELAPYGTSARRQVLDKCGSQCFLDADNLKYPICPKCDNGVCSCKVNCKGVQSAYNRARQYHTQDIAEKARKAQYKHCK